MKATCHIIFCVSNTMNIFAKFHQNIPNLPEEIEKNIENVLTLPPPKKKETKLKIVQAKGNTPIKSFHFTAIRL